MSMIRIKFGDNELEAEGADSFIKKYTDDFYKHIKSPQVSPTPVTLKKDIQESITKKPSTKTLTPAEYYRIKNRTDGISQILIFGKYLEEYKGISEFTPQDINDIGTQAKLSKNIHPQYFSNAVKQGLLRNLGNSKYSLTLSAEDALSAMK